MNVRKIISFFPSFLYLDQFGEIGLDGDVNRATIQAAINYSSLTGRSILLTEQSYTINIDSSGRGIEFKKNMSLVSTTEAVFDFRAENFKSQAFGGAVTEDQIRAVTIDNSVAPVNNLTVRNLTLSTPRERWYDDDGFLVSIPIAIYFNNTNLDADFANAEPATNWNFTNFNVENFQRTSVTVRGRKVTYVNWTGSSFTDIATAELQYPTESRYIYTEVVVNDLATNTTSYNFGVSDLVGCSVVLKNGSTTLYSIPYPSTALVPAIGSIVGNPLTAGNLQWTLGAGIQAQITSISVVGHRRATDATGADSINGIGLDLSNAQYVNISDCDFSGCADQFSHYIYMTRITNDVTITNNRFFGRGIEHINVGGGIHIRGAAYNNVNVTYNTFTNTHDNINLSSITGAYCYGNTHVWNYDLPPNGNLIELQWGAITTKRYYNNTSVSTNLFQPYTHVTAYLPLSTSDIEIYNNNATNVNNLSPLSTGVNYHNNTVVGSAYTVTGTPLIVMSHDNVNDVLGITFDSNNITFGATTPQPLIQGFTGFTWTNNTINNVNIFRLGDGSKLKNVTVSGAINSLRLNCSGTINISNFTGIVSYLSSAVYLDMFQNQNVTMTNCTDTGPTQRPVSNNEFIIVGTGAKTFTAASAQNLAYIDARVFTNTSLYQQVLTNGSAFNVTVKNYSAAFHTRNNIETPGGLDVIIPPLGSRTIQVDKVNGRLLLI